MAASKLAVGGSWFFLFRFATVVGRRACISTVLPSHGFGARKLRHDEVALARAKGSMGTLPSASKASLPPKKLSPPILGSGALTRTRPMLLRALPRPAKVPLWTWANVQLQGPFQA